MTRRTVKRCSLCRLAKQPARFTCTNCGTGCCEHLCINKHKPTLVSAPVRGALPAWCGTCARLPLGSPERIARANKEGK